MQALPDARQQSFDEIYGPPENFLEIEVLNPVKRFPSPLLPLLSPLYTHPPTETHKCTKKQAL